MTGLRAALGCIRAASTADLQDMFWTGAVLVGAGMVGLFLMILGVK